MYEYDFRETLCDNKILQKHKDLLRVLSNDRTMCVGYEQDGTFYIQECCDDWYYHNLTKEECMELSEMFEEIAEAIGT